MIGAGIGLLFAAAISTAERHRTVVTLSTRRFTLWGAAAGFALPVGVTGALLLRDNGSIPSIVAPGLIIALVGGAVGAAVAALSLRIARKTLFPGAAMQFSSPDVFSRKPALLKTERTRIRQPLDQEMPGYSGTGSRSDYGRREPA